MQYLSSFSSVIANKFPAVFFDSKDLDSGVDQEITSQMLRKARTALGADYRLNPVRGQTEGKYYFTYLTNAIKYGSTGSTIEAKYSDVNTFLAGTEVSPMTSNKKDAYVVWSPIQLSTRHSTGYNPWPAGTSTCVLLPGLGHRQIHWAPFNISLGGTWVSSVYQYYFMYSGDFGSASKKLEYRAIIPSFHKGNFPVDATFDVVTDNQHLIVGPICTTYTCGSYGGMYWGNDNGATDGLMFSTEDLGIDPETVNLDTCFVSYGANFFSLRSGVDYGVDSDLVPGTRPYVSFPQSSLTL